MFNRTSTYSYSMDIPWSMEMEPNESPQWKASDRVLSGFAQHNCSSTSGNVSACTEVQTEQALCHVEDPLDLPNVPLFDKHIQSDYSFRHQENTIPSTTSTSSCPSSKNGEYDLSLTECPRPLVPGQIIGVKSEVETRLESNGDNLAFKQISALHGATESESRMINTSSTQSGFPCPLPGVSPQILGLKCAGEAQSEDGTLGPSSGQLVQMESLDAGTQPENGSDPHVHSQAWTDIIQCIPSPLSVHLPTQEPQLVSSPKTSVSQSRPELQTASGGLPTEQDLECNNVQDERRSEVSTCTRMQVGRKPVHEHMQGHTKVNGNTSIEAKINHFMNMPSVKKQNKDWLSESKYQLPELSSRVQRANARSAKNDFNPANSLLSSQKGIKAIAALTRKLVPNGYWKNMQPRHPADGNQKSMQPRHQADGNQKNVQPRHQADGNQKNVQPQNSDEGYLKYVQPNPTLSVHLLSDLGSKSDGLLTCEICEEKFASVAELEKHLPVHMAVWKVKCSICDKRFTDKKYLLAHMISHGAEKPFECDICHASFAYPDTLKKHKKRKHIEGRRRCKECHRIYEYGEYEKHAKQYHSEDPLERNKPYECDICFLRFRMPAILQNHKFTHSNEKTYLCAECGKTFRTAQARQSHSKMHSDKHVAEKMKKVPCKICKKEYFKHCMRQHEKLHNLERKFMCEKCGKTFLMKHHLHNHEKSHLDEKPHVCEICDTSFRLAHHLRAHRKTHKATNKNK